MSFTTLLSKKQQVLGNGIPPRDDPIEEKEAKTEFTFVKNQSHENHQLSDLSYNSANPLEDLKSLRFHHLLHKYDNTNSTHTISLYFSDPSHYSEQDCLLEHLNVEEFNTDLILSKDFQLITPILFTEVGRIISKKDGTTIGIEYTFSSDEEIENIRFCRDEIARLKSSQNPKEKLIFVHNFCWTASYVLTTYQACWQSLDDVIIADTKTGRTHFLLIGCHEYKQAPYIENPTPYVLTSIEKKDKAAEDKCYVEYSLYFKRLLGDLFGLTPEKLSKTSMQKKNEALLETKISCLFKSIPQAKDITHETLQIIHSSLLSIYVSFQSIRKKTPKENKFEKTQMKIDKAIGCLSKYVNLFVLDIDFIKGADLSKFKYDIRSGGIGEVFFIHSAKFVEKILPNIKQYKEERIQRPKNTKLLSEFKVLRRNVLLLFTNKDFAEAQKFINLVETRRELVPKLGDVIKQDITIPSEWLRLPADNKCFIVMAKFGLCTKIDKGCYISVNDLHIEKGYVVDSIFKTLWNSLGKYIRESLPYSYQMKIVGVFHDGYLLPMKIIEIAAKPEEFVAKALANSFGYIQAVQAETNQPISDMHEIYKIRQKFSDILRTIAAFYWKENCRLPNSLKQIRVYDEEFVENEKIFPNENSDDKGELQALFDEIIVERSEDKIIKEKWTYDY